MIIEIGALERREGVVQVDRYGSPDVRADIRALPFRHLDRIEASHVLEHVPDADIVVALKSCRRALKPEGILDIHVPDLLWAMRRFLRSQSQGERWGFWQRFIYGSQAGEGQFHQTGFSVKRLSDCLVAAGFRTVRVNRIRREEHMKEVEVHGVATA